MIFANADYALPRVVQTVVGITHVGCGRDRARLACEFLAVNTLVGKVREVDDAIRSEIVAAAVFVNASARVERLWRQVRLSTVWLTPDDHVAASFLRPHLDPVNVVAVKRRLADADGSLNYEV